MIFGGFHLKQTFELAFCCAASFAHARPTFISADPCTFRNPVPVGSVLYLTATVAYTDPPLVSTLLSSAASLLHRWMSRSVDQSKTTNGRDHSLRKTAASLSRGMIASP